MGRAVNEIRVAKNPDEIRQFLAGWFQNNKYEINDWNASGEPIKLWRKAIRVKITPRPGAIVASHIGFGGAIVFEVLLIPEGSNTNMHVEGYAATAGITAGGEMDLSPNPGMSGMLPRKKGYEVMTRLFADVGAMGGAPGQVQQSHAQPQPQQQQYAQPQVPQQQYPQQQYPQQQYPQQQAHQQASQHQVPQQHQYQQPQQTQPTQQPASTPAAQQVPAATPQAAPTTAPPTTASPATPTSAAPAAHPKFCTQCGTALGTESKFCGGCGAPVPGS